MQNTSFANELSKRENKRLNDALKPDEKFCPACGRTIKKTADLCEWCNGK